MSIVKKVLAALSLSFCLNVGAFAQLGGGDGGPETPIEPGDVQAKYQTAGLDVLDASVFGDHIDIDTGALSFRHVDVNLPGNSGLPVMFGREKSRSFPREGFGDREPIIPHIKQKYLSVNGSPNARCGPHGGNPFVTEIPLGAGPHQTVNVAVAYVWQYWDGFALSDGSSSRALLSYVGSEEFAANNPDLVSKDNWIINCVGSASGPTGQTFVATSPNGTRYTFDVPFSTSTGSKVEQLGVSIDGLYVSRIEDVHGNFVSYSYNGDRLTRIEANDGRVITVSWSGDKITRVSANGRHWNYSYSNGFRATLPDGSYWQIYNSDALWLADPDDACMDIYNDMTVRHPMGATATFSFDDIWNGRTNVPAYQPANGVQLQLG